MDGIYGKHWDLQLYWKNKINAHLSNAERIYAKEDDKTLEIFFNLFSEISYKIFKFLIIFHFRVALSNNAL